MIELEANLDEKENGPPDCWIIEPPFHLVLECLDKFLNETG